MNNVRRVQRENKVVRINKDSNLLERYLFGMMVDQGNLVIVPLGSSKHLKVVVVKTDLRVVISI